MDTTRKFLIIATAMAAALMVFVDGGKGAYTTDSMIYISAAEHLRSDQRLLMTNFDIIPAAEDVVPLRYYPPGFSVLIALCGFLGLDPAASAALIPKLSFIALPAAFYFLFRQFCSPGLSMVIAALNTLMSVVFKYSLLALTDIPYLALSLVALTWAIKGLKEERSACLFTAGLLSGLCIMLRFLGGALAVAVSAGLVGALLLKRTTPKKFLRMVIGYGAGCAVVLLPYVLPKFFQPQPFGDIIQQTGPTPLLNTVHTYLATMAYLYFGHHAYMSLFIFVLLGSLGFAVFWSAVRWRTGKLDAGKFLNGFMLVVYGLGGSAAVIVMVAHYRYYLDDRYPLQYAWVFTALLAGQAGMVLRALGQKHRLPLKPFAAFLILTFVVMQGFSAVDTYVFFKNRNRVYGDVLSAAEALRAIPEDAVIVSNAQDMLNLMTRRNVRMLSNVTPLGLDRLIGSQRPLVVVLLLEGAYDLPGWRPIIYGKVPAGFRLTFNNGKIAILKHVGPHK